MRLNPPPDCPECGKEKPTERHFDARGIYITRCCDECWTLLRKRYRPEVLTDSNYECDEPIDDPT